MTESNGYTCVSQTMKKAVGWILGAVLVGLMIGQDSPAQAVGFATQVCTVTQKLNSELAYSASDLRRERWSVRVLDTPNGSILQRCSLSRQSQEVTCDSYPVDRVEVDQNIAARKYYVFRSQFDMQIFSNGSFVENNGRGGIAFGSCTKGP